VNTGIALLMMLQSAPPQSGDAGPASLPASLIVYQSVVQQTIIIRVPPQSQPTNFNASTQKGGNRKSTPPQQIEWKDRKAPKCLPMRNVVAVQVTRKDSIDLITRERQRLRAQLDGRCRGQDFYSGFYMERSKDGQLCEDRDILQTRSGLKCEVDKFRLMVPVLKQGKK
jgi:hypothetical protein